MRKISAKKGFIGVFWVAAMMFIMTGLMMTAMLISAAFMEIPESLLMHPFQGQYNAEFGIWYGKHLIDVFTDTHITGLLPNGSYTYPAIPVSGDTVVLTIMRSPTGGPHAHYTIISRAVLSNVVLTAHWDDGVLTMP